MPKWKKRRMNQAEMEAWRTRREQSEREKLERQREERERVEMERREGAARSRGEGGSGDGARTAPELRHGNDERERLGRASEDESRTEEEPVKRPEDLTIEDLAGYDINKYHGTKGFVVGTTMTWRQYMEGGRVFGDPSFQLIVPKKYQGMIPTIDVVQRDPTLQHLVGVAWELWEARKPPAIPRAPSPPSELALAWGETEDAKSTWTPYQYYWPSIDDPTWVVYSNRVIMPPPPTDPEKKLRADARYGIHERQWLPQHCASERMRPYMAFIPMLRPWKRDERHLFERNDTWFFKTAESPDQDIAWMRFDKERHTVAAAEGLWRFRDSVRAAVRQEATRTHLAWDEARDMAGSHEPFWRQWEKYSGSIDREHTASAMAYVMSESGTEWVLRCALGAFQRGILEVRGYIEYLKALYRMRDLSMYDKHRQLEPTRGEVARMTRYFNRRDSRGVFVENQDDAVTFARYGVPVWWVEKYNSTKHGTRLHRQDGVPVLSYGLVPELDEIVFEDAPCKGHDSASQAATRKQQEEKEKHEAAMAAVHQEQRAGFQGEEGQAGDNGAPSAFDIDESDVAFQHEARQRPGGAEAGFQGEQGQAVDDGAPSAFDVDESDIGFQHEAWQPAGAAQVGREVVTNRRTDTPPKNTGASSPARSTSSTSRHVDADGASDDGWVQADDARLEPEEDDSDYEALLREQTMRKLAQSKKQRRPPRWLLKPHPSNVSTQQQQGASETVEAVNALLASAQEGVSQTATAENRQPATVPEDETPDSRGATTSTTPISQQAISQPAEVPRVQQRMYSTAFDDGADLPDYEEDETPHPHIAIAGADQPAGSDSGVMRLDSSQPAVLEGGVMRLGSLLQKRKDPPTAADAPAPVRRKRNAQRNTMLHKTLKSMPEGAQLKGLLIRMTTRWEAQYDLPDWWPSTLQVGTEAAQYVDKSRQREARLAGCTNPVPQLHKGAKTVHKMPTLDYFANAWSNRSDQQKTSKRNVFQGLFRWLQIRPYYLAKIASDPIDEDAGFETKQWREIIKGVMPNRESRPIVKRLGLDVAHATIMEGQDGVDVEKAERLLSLRPLLEKLKDKCTFDGHELPPPPWESEESLPLNWVSYIVWELAELEFRYDMLDLAMSMRRWYSNIPELQAVSTLEYYGLVKDCWAGGIEMVKPTRETWLCSSNARERLLALRSFAELMRYWPRASEMLGPWKDHWDADNDAPALESDEFRELERSAWVCYQQTFYDHRGRMAPLPCRRPPPPFAVENSQD